MQLQAHEPADNLEILLAATICGIGPGRITGFTLVVDLDDGRQAVTTTACCAAHAGHDLQAITCPQLGQLVPCARTHG